MAATAPTLEPADRRRRSPLYRVCAELGAVWEDVNGFAAPAHYGDAAGEATAAAALALADLTALPRAGYKGWAMAGWASERGLALPAPNRASIEADGTLSCRLSDGELLLLAPDDAGTIERLAAAWTMEGAACFPVPRADTNAWLAVAGRRAPEMMAKLCGVDLRPHRFDDLRIAQTSVARMNAIVLRRDRGGAYALDLVFDAAAAVYMWECLSDAMAEFRGRVVGLRALEALARRAAPVADVRP